MNKLEKLKDRVLRSLPGSEASLEVPRKKTGTWWLDLSHQGHKVTVEWRPRQGFGIHCSSGESPYSGPEEVSTDLETTARRVLTLLRDRMFARPPRSVLLRELREMADLTQVELAERLGVGQGSVSKMERRKDITLVLLKKWIESMGGDLEILAKFPDEVVRIGQFDDIDDAA